MSPTGQTDRPGKGGTEIVVNAEVHQVPDRTVTYEQIVDLAFPGLTPDENNTFTVLYRKTDNGRPEGSLVAGGMVKVHKEGSSFSVTHSIRS